MKFSIRRSHITIELTFETIKLTISLKTIEPVRGASP